MSSRLSRHCLLLWLFAVLCYTYPGGCYRYVQFPVATQVERLSVPYMLRIENQTGVDIRIKPNSAGELKGLTPILVRPSEFFDIALTVRSLKVGNDSLTPTHGAVSTVFVEGAGQPNAARVIVEHGPGFTQEYDLDIDLESEKWFDKWTVAQPEPKQLLVKLENFRKIRWFLRGPEDP